MKQLGCFQPAAIWIQQTNNLEDCSLKSDVQKTKTTKKTFYMGLSRGSNLTSLFVIITKLLM